MPLESQRLIVERRARWLCEYCRAPQRICGYRFHLEHIIPRKLGGSDGLSNLALACAPCNLAKGVRIQAADPETSEPVPLFHPRINRWDEHFTWADDGCTLMGLTPTGRATIVALDLNADLRTTARLDWLELGLLP